MVALTLVTMMILTCCGVVVRYGLHETKTVAAAFALVTTAWSSRLMALDGTYLWSMPWVFTALAMSAAGLGLLEEHFEKEGDTRAR